MQANDPTAPSVFDEDAVVADLMAARNRRDNPTRSYPADHDTLEAMHRRVGRAEASMKNLRVLTLAAILLTVMALAGVATVMMTIRSQPTLEDTRLLFEQSLKQPIERLERAVDRLEKKLPSLP